MMEKAMNERSFKTYCCEYFHDGSWWGLTITAYDWSDAEVRAKKLGLRLLGEDGGTVSAKIPASGLFVKALTWFRNWRFDGKAT
jgi:hypothetical protein